MADSEIESSIKEQHSRLLDDIIAYNPKLYHSSMTLATKERVVKEGILEGLYDLLEGLNKHFSDVKFNYQWNPLIFHSHDGFPKYNESWDLTIEDEGYYDKDDYDIDENEDSDFLNMPLNDNNLKIDYWWYRTCSLGCKHITKRYYIVNIAKLLDLIAFWRLQQDPIIFVREFLPDFFYDPRPIQELYRPTEPEFEYIKPKKRGRPRKLPNNSCTP